MILDEIDARSRAILESSGFDPLGFERLRAELVAGRLHAEANVVRGHVEPPLASDLTPLPAPDDPGYEEAFSAGSEAVRAGRVGMLILAGGMATRFGGGVKAVAEALDGRSFLEIRIEETRRLERELDGRVPIVLMTSFATDAEVAAHVEERRLGPVRRFQQAAAPRLRPDGALLLADDGAASLYGPGHGDLLDCVRSSGMLDELAAEGVTTLMVSNVDNLPARIDPAVVGMHRIAERPFTVEVVRRGSDIGGAPARVDGRLQLVEAVRFPPSFDQQQIPVFNTNTSLIELDALREPVQLTWLVVRKRVDGEEAIQFERLYHELSAHVPTTYLVVPRVGPRGRFLPVKEPSDLAAVQAELRAMLDGSLAG